MTGILFSSNIVHLLQIFYVCIHLPGGEGLALWAAAGAGGHTRQALSPLLQRMFATIGLLTASL